MPITGIVLDPDLHPAPGLEISWGAEPAVPALNRYVPTERNSPSSVGRCS